MKELFTIGELAKAYGINYRTLRYYDDIGLLNPEVIGEENNYRYYTTKQFERLNTILYLRELDIPIAKIKDFLDNKEVNNILDIFKAQKQEIKLRKKQLNIIEKKLQHRIEYFEDAISSETDVIKVVHMPERKLSSMYKTINGCSELEGYLREIAGTNAGNFIIFMGKVGFFRKQEDIEKSDITNFSGIFIFLEKEDEFEGNIINLPENDYLVMRFQGYHTDSTIYYEKMLDYIKKNGMEIAGEIMEISMIDYCITSDKNKYITEIQIPIKKCLTSQ